MKRVLLSMAVVVLLVAMLPLTAFACGHGGGRRVSANVSNTTSWYALCSVDECEIYGPHRHDESWYCNQTGIDWNNYGICAVEDCFELGFHEHDETWYHCADYANVGGHHRGYARYWQ